MQFNDGQLLARFIQNREESAFEDIVRRHAVMVMAACRMVLRDGRDAEEAFQNAFMVLARKANQHTGKKSINGWLYRAAVLEALNIRNKRLVRVRNIVEQRDVEMIAEQEPDSATGLESMKALLAEELNRLADKYSLPLIFCYLEGKSIEQAAHDLGLGESALKVRLMRGREMLRKRLIRRGVTVSSGMLGTILIEQVAKSAEVVSEVLLKSTVKAAMAALSAATTAGILAGGWKGVLFAMTMKKTAAIIGGVVLLGLAGAFLYPGSQTQKAGTHKAAENSITARKSRALSAAGAYSTQETSEAAPSETNQAGEACDLKKQRLPASAQEYYKRFKEVMNAQGSGRWKILREMGIELTDAEFEAAWQKARSDTRFKDLKHLMGLPDFNGEEAALFLKLQDAIFAQWVADDPLAAIEWAKKLPEAKYYYVSYDKERILPEWETLTKLKIFSNPNEGFVTAVVALWARNDMNTAAKWAKEQSLGTDRETAQLGIAIAMSVQDAKGAMEFLEKKNLSSNRFEISYILSHWALANPVEAVNYINKNSLGMNYSDIGYQWAKTDLKDALAWTKQLSGKENDRFMDGIICQWAKEDFVAARDYVTSMWERHGKNGAVLWTLADFWLEKDPQACAEWAMRWIDKKGSSSAAALCPYICQQWANKDYEAAFDWIEQLPEGDLKKEMWNAAAGGMIDAMCENDEISSFKEGINLIDETFSEEDVAREGLYWHMINTWEWRETEMVNERTEWIKTLPVGADKDYIVSKFCRLQNQTHKTSCPDLIQLASGMQDEKSRQDTCEKIFNRWIREDSSSAKQWLQNSALPQPVKEKWLAGK